MLAIGRAVDGVLPLRAATHGANFAADSRTVPACTFLLANFADNIHRGLSPSYHRRMRRTDLYVKVELDVDEKEKPERLANEICRMIRKVYGVRSAEVSSMVEKD